MSSANSLRYADIIVSVLVHIDRESNVPGVSEEEFAKCGLRLTRVLNKVEQESGTQFMMSMFIAASKRAGHTIGPLDSRFIQKLVKNGCIIKNVRRVLTCERSPAADVFMGFQNDM